MQQLPDWTDDEILALLKGSDVEQERAMKHVYAKWKNMAYSMAKKMGIGQEDDMEGAYTKALVTFWEKNRYGSDFRGDSALSTYFMKFFSNKCLNELDKIKRAKRRDGNRMEEIPDIPDSNNWEDAFHSEELKEHFVKLILKWTGERCYQIWKMSLLEERSTEDIVQALGIKGGLSVLKNLKSRCFKNMKAHLDNDPEYQELKKKRRK